MFPPAPAARPCIDFDGKGFLVHGKRTFIVAGALHYSRVPRALWRDRLLRIKRAGYNTVQTYTFWNYHELREGQYDFSGDKDFDAYLKLIHSLGMYAIVRIGPYVNAEWEGGGWPVWLRFKPGVDCPRRQRAVSGGDGPLDGSSAADCRARSKSRTAARSFWCNWKTRTRAARERI